MAVVNIKSFPDKLYKKLQARAKRERRSVAQEIIKLLDDAMTESTPTSILELQGLGKELWREAGDNYLRREREAWP